MADQPARPAGTTATPTGAPGATPVGPGPASATRPATAPAAPSATRPAGPAPAAAPPGAPPAQPSATHIDNPHPETGAVPIHAPQTNTIVLTEEQLARAAEILHSRGQQVQVAHTSSASTKPMKVTEASGSVGAPFAIYGEGFGTGGQLIVGGRLVPTLSWRDHVIKGNLPTDIPTGEVSVSISGQSFKIRVV